MNFSVDLRKTVRSERRSFELQVRFETAARRTVVYGPSGAGKSLTLQAIAGLLRPDHGRIAFGDDVLFDSVAGIDVAARRRGFGYLFQDYALFPRLNVRQNIAFGLEPGIRNPRRHVDSDAVRHWLRTFELDDVAEQLPADLSGGQRQRTALARALVTDPTALLLDEPFAALDKPLRERLRQELKELQAELGLPMLLITHDDDDVDSLGEQVVYLQSGHVTERIESVILKIA